MAEKFVIDIFVPPSFPRHSLDIEELNKLTGKNFIYASMGRFALYHILRSLDVKGKVLVPVYICDTVLIPLKILGLQPVFYDIDSEDLNGSLESIELMSKKYDVQTVLVASLYGNPANLVEIEKFCREKNIKLIDDAAQSFGAKLDDRLVGTFGSAGFFSFSPGKATAGHLGAFFWSKNSKYDFAKNKNCLFHYIAYLDYYFNRLNRYRYKKYGVFQALTYGKKILNKFVDVKNDDVCLFERDILGGILKSALTGKFCSRNRYFLEFVRMFEGNRCFRIIKSARGMPVNYKIVLSFFQRDLAMDFIGYLLRNRIYVCPGYRLLAKDLTDLPNVRDIDGKVVEIPLEDDAVKMEYLVSVVQNFLNENCTRTR